VLTARGLPARTGVVNRRDIERSGSGRRRRVTDLNNGRRNSTAAERDLITVDKTAGEKVDAVYDNRRTKGG
jgi:hypothetical protein